MLRSFRPAVLAALLALAACATPGKRAADIPAGDGVDTDAGVQRGFEAEADGTAGGESAASPDAHSPDGAESAESASARSTRDVWKRLRDGYAFAQCDASDSARRWQRTYARGPRHFAAMMERSLPFLLLVLDEIERRRLPTEFALLPIVESQYTPFAATGNRPAGMWQLMPGTARGRGLAIEAGYDGRLDVYASTQVALDLIHDLGSRFGDWRLANMAFNAGEYRVERALRDALLKHRHPKPGQLPVSPITHEHLAKLNAVACILSEPARFGVALPMPTDDMHLVAIALDAPASVTVAAKLAGLDAVAFRRYNPALRGTTIARGRMILIPAPRRAAFESALAALPASERMIVPASVAADAEPAAVADARGIYVVRRGDSLWRIAKQFKVSVAALLTWNGLAGDATLKPGQRLRVAGG